MATRESFVEADPGDAASCLVHVKAVPGAKRDEAAGVLALPDGVRLKVRISAPPEGGKANRAIAALLARALGVRAADVELISGPSNPQKTFRVRGVAAERARAIVP